MSPGPDPRAGDVAEDPDESLDINVEEDVWPFASERFRNEWAPCLLRAHPHGSAGVYEDDDDPLVE